MNFEEYKQIFLFKTWLSFNLLLFFTVFYLNLIAAVLRGQNELWLYHQETADCQLGSIKAASNLKPRERYFLQAGQQANPFVSADHDLVMHSNASLSLLRASELRCALCGPLLRSVASTAINVTTQYNCKLMARVVGHNEVVAKKQLPSWLACPTGWRLRLRLLSVRGELIDATAARRCPPWT